VKRYYFSNCPLNCEELFEQELSSLGAVISKKVRAGLYFEEAAEGDEALLYRVLLDSRLASGVELVLKEFDAVSKEELYREIYAIEWSRHMTALLTFACETAKVRDNFAPDNFLTLVTKDAVADYFNNSHGRRPAVSRENPEILITLHADANHFTAGLKLGRSLYKRGLRTAYKESESRPDNVLLIKKSHQAPLKENIAAALLMRADWPRMAAEGLPFIDPMCGSGTLLAEAFMMAAHKAPGSTRQFFGCEQWPGFKPELLEAERARVEKRFAEHRNSLPPFYGFDTGSYAVVQAREALKKAGAGDKVTIIQDNVLSMANPLPAACGGLIMTNPPYGERLLNKERALRLYADFGKALKKEFKGWQAAVILPEEEFVKTLDIRARRINVFFNGAVRRFLARFTIDDAAGTEDTGQLEASAVQLYNRLEKRYKILKKMALKQWQTNAFRLYDADLPEYNAACDIYDDILVVQEYKAPASIAEETARRRFKEFCHAVQKVTGTDRANLIIKVRRRQGALGQYQKNESAYTRERTVTENGMRFAVNLSGYLDTGLFLDHRPLRRLLLKESWGLRFLNLFAYTGAASVAALKGGAAEAVSVDASQTYLSTAEKNMRLNGFAGRRHVVFVKDDVRRFLKKTEGEWDIIYLDPPTYSNSKMRESFDIGKEHAGLIRLAMRHLAKGGQLYFSTHFRRFTLDSGLEESYLIKDMTAESLDEDFKRYPIHRLWRIKEKNHAF
jgi:23S rRNA (guanine2445-N2)-methyltransferase / 23S rRNA (guanine2069-N7)-methyltransferase